MLVPMVTGIQLLNRQNKPFPTLVPTPPELAQWPEAENTPYSALVGSLMYPNVDPMPDIAYAAGSLAFFLDCYRPELWSAAIWPCDSTSSKGHTALRASSGRVTTLDAPQLL
jgi:hypothetical protein